MDKKQQKVYDRIISSEFVSDLDLKSFELLKKIISDLIQKDIIIKFYKYNIIPNGTGEFDSETLSLRVYLDHFWFETLIHEYCHFLQYLENKNIFQGMYVFNKSRYRGRKNILSRACNKSAAVELDCEKRAVKIIRKNKIEVDLKRYIREANAYVITYYCIPIFGEYDSYQLYDISEYTPSTFRFDHRKFIKENYDLLQEIYLRK